MGLRGFFPNKEQLNTRHSDRLPKRTPHLGIPIKYEGFDHTSFQLPGKALPEVIPVGHEDESASVSSLSDIEKSDLLRKTAGKLSIDTSGYVIFVPEANIEELPEG